MDIIVRNLHDQATKRDVQKFFTPHLEKLGIHVFECQKLKSRGCATITLHDITKANLFLVTHGQPDTKNKRQAFLLVRIKLNHLGRDIYCCQSKNNPDPFVIQHLQQKANDRYAGLQRIPKIVPPKQGEVAVHEEERGYNFTKLRIGQWIYIRDHLTFSSHYGEERAGRIVFGSHAVLIKLLPATIDDQAHQMEIPYDSVQSLVTWSSPPSVTFSLFEPPKYYEEINTSLNDAFRGLLLQAHLQNFKRKRVPFFNATHESIVGNCLCYRFSLPSYGDAQALKRLSRAPGIPDSVDWNIRVVSNHAYADDMTQLRRALAQDYANKIPFEVIFQLQRLAQNSYLPPSTILQLKTEIFKSLDHKDSSTVASAVRHLSHNIPYAGPETEANTLELTSLIESFHHSENAVFEHDPYLTGLAAEHEHIAMVYKAMVTPAAILLAGPEPEIKNRVLRKHSANIDYFISVSFADENGDQLRFNRKTDSHDIFHKRFKKVLEKGITIGSRAFEVCLLPSICLFLGLMIEHPSFLVSPIHHCENKPAGSWHHSLRTRPLCTRRC